MSISGITEGAGSRPAEDAQEKTAPAGFAKVLNEAIPALSVSEAGNSHHEPLIELGRISSETPTISHILINHPEYAQRCWDIVFAPENRMKQFTKMREGTAVYFNPENNELIWREDLSHGRHHVHAEDQAAAQGIEPGGKNVLVGTISAEHPTVSQLFDAHPHFDRRYWNIIMSRVNRGKDYTALRPGTKVELNPSTMELHFVHGSPDRPAIQSAKIIEPVPGPDSKEKDYVTLADAVKPFMGIPYNEIDCYGLVVRGLVNQGIQYDGRGGLRERLEDLAARDGRPRNAYFSGEGLVEQAGVRAYSRNIPSISNPGGTTEEIFSELMPHLREGMILSFSTPTRGHTGVVSRQGTEWTYINSGVIDHEIFPRGVSKRVGEEILKAEIRNWCALAAARKEPLMVTAGHVEGNNARRYSGFKKTT